MKVIKFLFFTNETKAHTYATFPLASALMARGHRVTYVVTTYLALAVKNMGAECIIYKSVAENSLFDDFNNDPEIGPESPRNWEKILMYSGAYSKVNTSNLVTQLAELFGDDRPDVIIRDADIYAAHIFGRIYKIPVIQISPYFAYYENFFSEKSCAWCKPPISKGLIKRLNALIPLIFPLEELNIYLFPKIFQYNADLLGDNFFFAGPCFSSSRDASCSGLGRGDISTIVVAGSASAECGYDYYKFFINCLGGSPFKVVLSVGDRLSLNFLGNLPSNFVINDSAPQRDILPGASIFIGSGGAVSTFEALYQGVPVILIPQDIFHVEFAYRVQELGFGVVVNKSELKEKNLADAISKILSDKGMRERVNGLKSIAEDGAEVGRAVAKIEEYCFSKL